MKTRKKTHMKTEKTARAAGARRIPLSGGSWVTAILFAAVSGILLYGILFLWTNEVTVATGGEEVPMSFWMKVLLSVLFGTVLFGAVKLVFGLFLRAVTGRGAMTLSEDGIRDTFVIVGVLAFYTLLRVGFLPKDALIRVSDGAALTYRIDSAALDRIQAGRLTRRLLKSAGFRASIGRITEEEMEDYLKDTPPHSDV